MVWVLSASSRTKRNQTGTEKGKALGFFVGLLEKIEEDQYRNAAGNKKKK